MYQVPSSQPYLAPPWQGGQQYNGHPAMELHDTVSPITPSPSPPGISFTQAQQPSNMANRDFKTPTPAISTLHPTFTHDTKSLQADSDFDTYLTGYGSGFDHVSEDQSNSSFFHRHPYQPVDGLFGSRSDGTPRLRLLSWWWWWEIGASFVSIASMSLILAVLGKADGLALEEWPLSIQPNSLVAILTTIGKSAMMIVVASCISQLKWRHFQRGEGGGRPIADLQVFEDASRGPWGSAVFLGRNVRLGAVTAGVFALITVVALGIEPTVQQIFDFPGRMAVLGNVSSEVGRAEGYASKAYKRSHGHGDATGPGDIGLFNQETLLFQSRIINGVLGSVGEPSYSCPSSHCSWPDFSSLAVCSTYTDISDLAKPNCTIGKNGTDPYDLECEYDYKGRNDTEYLASMKWQLIEEEGGDVFPAFFSFFQSEVSNHTDAIGGTWGSMTSVRVTDPNKVARKVGPPVEMLRSEWYLCEQTHRNVTVVDGKLILGNITSTPLIPVKNETTADTGLPEDVLLTYASTTNPERTYAIPKLVPARMFDYLRTLLSNPFATRASVNETTGRTSGGILPGSNDLFPMGYFMNLTSLSNLTTNVAQTFSNQMRANVGGDNANLTMLVGTAYAQETYIRVRWGWVILPLGETLLSAVFLVVTIVLSRDTPLFKGSVLAFLVHGLRGWSESGIRGLYRRNTAEEVMRSSEGMRAVLREDEGGWLGFWRAG